MDLATALPNQLFTTSLASKAEVAGLGQAVGDVSWQVSVYGVAEGAQCLHSVTCMVSGAGGVAGTHAVMVQQQSGGGVVAAAGTPSITLAVRRNAVTHTCTAV